MQKQPEIIKHLTLFEEEGFYCAWPALARTRDGDLLALFTRTDEHMGPEGQIWQCRSRDQGSSWEKPTVVRNTVIDDRESGITTLADGSLLAHLWSTRHTEQSFLKMSENAYVSGVTDRWIDRVNQPDYLGPQDLHGAWNALSTDGGYSWSDPVRGADSIHGGIQLHSGDLLTAAYRNDGGSIGIYCAKKPLEPWTRVALISPPDAGSIRFGEPHVTQLQNGRVILMIRATAIPYDDQSPRCRPWVSWSDDDGCTWAPPEETGLWGFPPQLLTLEDGRVLATYGYRRHPFGERACISDDGIRWDPVGEFVLRDDAPDEDLGYPHSLEIEPGVILTIYYQPNVPAGTIIKNHPPDPNRVKAGILGTIWKVEAR